MGKNNKKNKKNNNDGNNNGAKNNNDGNIKHEKYPFVSICTPTFNRRPFIPYAIKCFEHQDYPKDRMEWIIIDDGTDKIEDLVKDIPQVKYFKYDGKMTLGKKRNLMHEKTIGDIIVYMDDDDYYPPQRVSHAVSMLKSHPSALCAGASEIYIYFKHIDKMYQFGPYGPNHATAGTFAFRRKLLENHHYEDTASLAEEKAFLKNYTVPFVQLEPKKTILVFSHRHNTFDKKKLLERGDHKLQHPSDKTVDEFIKEPDMKDFYMNRIEGLLVDYSAGAPDMKPDVLKQIKEIEADRQKQLEEMQRQQGGQIILNQDGKQIALNNNQIVEIMKRQQSHLGELTKALTEKDATIERMKANEQMLNQNLQKLIALLASKEKEIQELKSNTNFTTSHPVGDNNNA
jgi:glycosyltransferase involved in cell wall biosynthesis